VLDDENGEETTGMKDLHFRSATELAQRVRRGDIGARELLEQFLARVDLYNPTINAVIQQDRAGARARADAADGARNRGDALAWISQT
jgi:amidase